MKKVTILFKSGNKLTIKCKEFEITFEGDKKKLNMVHPNIDAWMIDLNQIEAYTVVRCLF